MGMKIDGGCHCGAIRFEAEVNPNRTIICHCTDYQTISGAPYRVNARSQDTILWSIVHGRCLTRPA